MKYNEIYTPVFKEKTRQLRADFGSRKVGLVCSSCKHEFMKRVGPNTSCIECPECGGNRTKTSIVEKAKKKLGSIKSHIDANMLMYVVKESLEIIDLLHGRTELTHTKIMKDAIDSLLRVERGLSERKDELTSYVIEGTGREEFKVISETLGYELFDDLDELPDLTKEDDVHV